ncbi:phosphatase PAP2 family protein [Tessaracoccus sp. MC1865]|uniref:phosphatase PAP2 family protein n=1 Tax=Tessaracoccus sp. MC1865 TaxID=2760310 RepID=UPI001602A148|nr:phosphatase PAP2 family protein [Tessaracoccus sp. MC1865]MBB1483139.1 phosphatase PAP2 family protein [Tessaracoccus sp. MC1865]QTO37433.1 phosphatase PAP2 family protein [Tessaracoccus sp. MC1865]
MQLPDSTPKAKASALLGTTLVVALLAAIGLTELFGEILESVGDRDGVAAWDRPALDWALAARTPGFTSFVAWYSNTGGPLWQPIITGVVVAFLCWRWRDITPLILTVIAVGGSLLITVLGKNYIGRARPPIAEAVPPYESSMSFPSGHSLNALVIAGILAYLLIRHVWNRKRGLTWLIAGLAALYAISMGLSRVFLGHHWLTDVFGAWAIGLAWLAVVIGCHRIWHAVRSRTEPGPVEEERAPA